jgi:dolichyl-phosphate-mannose-protein mannosyltransferase
METVEQDSQEIQRTTHVVNILLALIVAVGAVLRIIQYVKRGSLWLDEAMVAVSIVSRPARALLFSPLEFNQSAPPLFLQLAKFSARIFGPTDMALRLPSFLSSIAGLLFFALIARRVLKGTAAVIAVAFFAVAPMLLIYSSEVKPYSGDVFAAAVLLYVSIRLHASGFSRNWLLTAAATAGAVVWLSDTAIIVIGGLGLGLICVAFYEKDRRALRMAAYLAPVWILAAGAAAYGTRRRFAVFTGKLLHSLWAGGFVPLVPRTTRDVLYVPSIIDKFFREALGIRSLAGLCLVVVLFGGWSLWKSKNRAACALITGPVIVAIIAGAAKMYPFTGGRVSLFLAPSFIILLAAGFERIGSIWPRRAIPIQAALFLVFVNPFPFVLQLRTPPWLVEQIEPVLSAVAANRKPGDRIYVFWSAVPATMYYGPRHGITPDSWTAGGLHGDDWHGYVPELDKLRGSRRVWVIFSHSKVPGQREGIMNYLDSLGRRPPVFSYPPANSANRDASTALYDLSRAAGESTTNTGMQRH